MDLFVYISNNSFIFVDHMHRETQLLMDIRSSNYKDLRVTESLTMYLVIFLGIGRVNGFFIHYTYLFCSIVMVYIRYAVREGSQ